MSLFAADGAPLHVKKYMYPFLKSCIYLAHMRMRDCETNVSALWISQSICIYAADTKEVSAPQPSDSLDIYQQQVSWVYTYLQIPQTPSMPTDASTTDFFLLASVWPREVLCPIVCCHRNSPSDRRAACFCSAHLFVLKACIGLSIILL